MRTRFAPSPTGLLHLGNVYSALTCEQWAKEHHAELVLRVEDIDFTRCKPQYTQQLLDDLAWLGIRFSKVSYQQQRLALYEQALQKLIDMGVLYPCFCTRKQIAAALDMSKGTCRHALDPYPGTCKQLHHQQRQHNMSQQPYAWRLDCTLVSQQLGRLGTWQDTQGHEHDFDIVKDIGDVVIGRKDIRFSYHLCVVVDDAEQTMSHVIRGEDLRNSTPVHRVLQQLLSYDSPQYLHHKLITNQEGMRLAKSKASPALKALRDAGVTAQDIRSALGF